MLGRRQLIHNLFAAMASVAFVGAARRARAEVPTVFDDTLRATVPQGARLRIVAQTGKPAIAGGSYLWHAAPDGGACFTAPDGGWIYVSNSEMRNKRGGAGALRFDAAGNVVDSYPILRGTSINCAGGKTPWGTWLSCEENGDEGLVYECDPTGATAAVVRPGLGAFQHEAAAIDPATGIAYLTEDRPDGCFYRFVPRAVGDLSSGRLEVAVPDGTRLTWAPVPDPSSVTAPSRRQVRAAAIFKGGEGIVYAGGKVYFTTKVDNRVWSYTLATGEIAVIYDASTSDTPILRGVDNIEVSPSGELLIAEDGGDMQIVALGRDYTPYALVTLHGHDNSEIAGPAFSPDGKRLYFSSQRGTGGRSETGLTYELTLA